MKKVLAFLLLLALLTGCAAGPSAGETGRDVPETSAPTPQDSSGQPDVQQNASLYVGAVTGMPEDFILGMDASQVPALEKSGVKYYDAQGNEKDVFRILSENGVNCIRVRVWNDPFDSEGHGYGGGNCTAETALEIGKRATQYGMPLLVDFHYSDFWADPGKQMVPKAWRDLDLEAKAAALEQYTRQSLQMLRDADVAVCMVQVGNETNGAMCGETDWPSVIRLMSAGAKAVREVYPEAKVAVHFADPQNGAYPDYAAVLEQYQLDYDVFGSSYYPFWHGTLENLTAVLGGIRSDYGKDVMVMETSYPWTGEDSDFSGNTITDSSSVSKPYPFSVQGQANSVRDVVQAAVDAGGIGVCYWEGTWISVGGSSKEENQKLWEQYGSGWASSYAAEYDPQDAGKWYGGCAVDNQAFFDASGRALESLAVFSLLRSGNGAAASILSIEELELRAAVGESPELPSVVNAVMSDNSRKSVPVVWSAGESELAQWLSAPGSYEITGEAEGLPAKLRLIVTAENLLANPSFESGETADWKAENLGGCRELCAEQKSADSRTGGWHYHFWTPDAGTAEFTLEQTVPDAQPGSYDYSIWIMGGDCGSTEIYAYAKVDGEIVSEAPMQITVWNEWHQGTITDIEIGQGQTLTVGIYVKADAAGAWGKIDDASVTRR